MRAVFMKNWALRASLCVLSTVWLIATDEIESQLGTTSTALAQADAAAGGGAAPDRAAARKEDLDALVRELPRAHVRAFTKVTKEQFEAEAAKIGERLAQMEDEEFLIALMRLTAKIGDAHTRIGVASRKDDLAMAPIGALWLRDGIFVTAVPAEQKDVLGARVVKVGGVAMEDAAKRLEGMAACENEASRKMNVAQWISRPAALRACGLSETRERAVYTVATVGGGERAVELGVMAPNSKIDWVTLPSRDAAGLAASRQARTDWYGARMLDGGVMYVWYDRCAEQPNRPFGPWAEETLATIDREKPRRMIIDLQRNGGGNSAIFRPLVEGLAKRELLKQPGMVMTIIGRGTFSSGMMNAMDLKRGGATLVGEPTGQKPNSFGEIKTFTLPRSGWVVQYSTKEWRLAPEGDPESLMPDVRADIGSADFFAGRDVALEAAVAYEAPH